MWRQLIPTLLNEVCSEGLPKLFYESCIGEGKAIICLISECCTYLRKSESRLQQKLEKVVPKYDVTQFWTNFDSPPHIVTLFNNEALIPSSQNN